MNDPVADTDQSPKSEQDYVRGVQELIDQQSSADPNALWFDGDTEACIELLKGDRFFDLHLVPAALEASEAAAGAVNAPQVSREEIRSWQLQYRGVLGAGGFAVVLAVHAQPVDQTFAMKILRPSLRWSKSHQKRFLKEAELTSLVTHPGIVPIIGTGLINSNPFILSEHVDGPNLAQFLAAHGPVLDVQTAVTWTRSLAQTLQAAHEAGILHRDLKPENILLQSERDGQQVTPRITDFGLARRFQQSVANSVESSTGNVLVGTARYMAPEVVGGHIQTGSISADVYSLAAVIFQCVTGRVPYDGRGYLDIVAQMQRAPAPSAHRLNPNVSASLSLVLQIALCRAPHLRYQTAAEFDADLGRVQQGRPVAALQSRMSRRFWEFTTGHPRATTAILVIALILPIAFIVTSILYYREKTAMEQHRAMLQATMTSVRDYINLAENVLDKVPASAQERYELLKKALAAQELVAQGLDYNAESRYRLSVLQSLLADAAWRMSDAPLSLEHTSHCLEMLKRLRQDDPENIDYQYDVFYSKMCISSRYPHSTRAELITSKREILREVIELNRLSPENPDFIDALASSYFSLGQALSYTLNDDGRVELEHSIRISDRLWRQHPEKLIYTKYALIGRSLLADQYRRYGNLPASERLALEAITVAKTIQHPERGEAWFLEIVKEPTRSYAMTLRDLKRWGEAESAFHDCVALEDQLYQDNPLHTPYALSRAIFAAEELRAARKGNAGPDKESELLQKCQDRLEDLRSTKSWTDHIPRIEALIANPDAEPV